MYTEILLGTLRLTNKAKTVVEYNWLLCFKYILIYSANLYMLTQT